MYFRPHHKVAFGITAQSRDGFAQSRINLRESTLKLLIFI